MANVTIEKGINSNAIIARFKKVYEYPKSEMFKFQFSKGLTYFPVRPQDKEVSLGVIYKPEGSPFTQSFEIIIAPPYRTLTPTYLENKLRHTLTRTIYDPKLGTKIVTSRFQLELTFLHEQLLQHFVDMIFKNDDPRKNYTWVPILQDIIIEREQNHRNPLKKTKKKHLQDDGVMLDADPEPPTIRYGIKAKPLKFNHTLDPFNGNIQTTGGGAVTYTTTTGEGATMPNTTHNYIIPDEELAKYVTPAKKMRLEDALMEEKVKARQEREVNEAPEPTSNNARYNSALNLALEMEYQKMKRQAEETLWSWK